MWFRRFPDPGSFGAIVRSTEPTVLSGALDRFLGLSLAAAAALALVKSVFALGFSTFGQTSPDWARVSLVLAFVVASALLGSAKVGAEKSRALAGLMALLGAALSLRLVLPWNHLELWRALHPYLS